MKKLTLFAALLMFVQVAFAGGILTNTNQSAQFVRMLSRNASTQLDAVYFNPAGVVKLEDGLHFGIHNQSIFQTRTITSEFPYLNNSSYEGKISAPLFPDVYAAWKKNKLAISLMFGPVGGGGGAKYAKGLPSFEKQISQLVPGLAGLSALGYNVSEYGVDISFEGTSVFWGLQGGITYGLGDAFSVYGGVRYLPSTNTYNGYMKNISLIVNGTSQSAQTFLNGASAAIVTKAQGASAAASSLQPLITGGAGTFTLAQVQGAGRIDQATRTQIEGGLLALGITQAQINAMNVGQIQGAFTSGATTLNTQAATLAGTATQMGDKRVDVKQTGAGITPIFGVNISPAENLNIGIKYELKTTLKLTNETTNDDLGMFPAGQETNSDLPAILTAGVDYKFSDKFSAQLSFTNYFDKGVNWGYNIYKQKREIDNNSWELSLGLQYNISNNFAVSIGGMQSTSGVSEQYQSDFSYSNTSNTGGLGFQWKLNKALTLDAGMLYTVYKDANKDFIVPYPVAYKETYDKKNIGFAIGIGYSIF